jgi:heme/copper-type cytochrome/quinol oxidase subunit 2
VSLATLGSVLADCVYDPRHPHAGCNDVVGQSDNSFMMVMFAALAVALIVSGLLMVTLWRRRDRRTRSHAES